MKFEISKLKEYLETIDKIKNLSLRGWIDTEFADNIAELTKLELEDYIKKVLDAKLKEREAETKKAEKSGISLSRKQDTQKTSSK